MIKENNDISFSVFHLNIKSLNQNFDSLKHLLVELNFCFKIPKKKKKTNLGCSVDLHTNNKCRLPNYVSIHQVRKNRKTGGGIRICIPKELIYNIRLDLSVNNEDTEALCLEIIINRKSKNIFINIIYRQPSGNKKNFKNYFGKFLEKAKSKIAYLLVDFSLNIPDYDANLKVKSYCNTAFSHNFIPIITKSTRVMNPNATIMDHIMTNSFDSKIYNKILKVDISHHFFNLFHLQIKKC